MYNLNVNITIDEMLTPLNKLNNIRNFCFVSFFHVLLYKVIILFFKICDTQYLILIIGYIKLSYKPLRQKYSYFLKSYLMFGCEP